MWCDPARSSPVQVLHEKLPDEWESNHSSLWIKLPELHTGQDPERHGGGTGGL